MAGAQSGFRPSHTSAEWKRSLPKTYDIVLCRFPYDEAPEYPAVEHHPVLVLGVDTKSDPNVVFLHVAYGTSQHIDTAENSDFVLPPPSASDEVKKRALRSSRILKATKFILTRTKVLPYNRNWFYSPSGSPTPRVGCIDPSLIVQFFNPARVAAEMKIGNSLLPGKPPIAALSLAGTAAGMPPNTVSATPSALPSE